MALYNCPDCGNSVSDKAIKCPKCGCPIVYIVDNKIANASAEETLGRASQFLSDTSPAQKNSISHIISNYFLVLNVKPSERTGRKSYWLYVIINMIFTPIASLLVTILLGCISDPLAIIGLQSCLFSSFILWIKAGITRLHDIGKSGAYMWFIVLPILGWIILLYLHIKPSVNKPKADYSDNLLQEIKINIKELNN